MAAAGEPFLRIENVSKFFGSFQAVKDVSLDVAKGEIFSLLGGSGCGKTTLLRMLAGFEEPTSGKIFLDGRDMTGVPPWSRPVHMMFQSYALFPHMTVAENVAYGLMVKGVDRAKRAAEAEKALALVVMKTSRVGAIALASLRKVRVVLSADLEARSTVRPKASVNST